MSDQTNNDLEQEVGTGEGAENIEATVSTNGDLDLNSELETITGDEAVNETPPEDTQEVSEVDDSLDGFIDVTDESDENLEEIVNGDTTGTTTETPEVVTPAPAPTATTKIPFSERAEAMGLTVMPGRTYHYADRFSEIAYKHVKTYNDGSGIVDDLEIPHLAIFTKGLEADSTWIYQNYISDSYQFIGNDAVISQIRDSIAAIGNPEIQEKTLMAVNLTEIRHELIIVNGTDIPQVGSILPMMNVSNTYNGTGASTILFGMAIVEADNTVSSISSDKFGKIKQIHLNGATTELSAALGGYVTILNDNIQEVISTNFERQVSIEEMLALLDKIETKVGKKRREVIATSLPNNEDPAAVTAWNLNSWDLFLALTRFTSVEKNINSKKILESVVESVLVLPGQMVEALKTING